VIYLKNSVGIEIRGEDLVLSCLKSNLSGKVLAGLQTVSSFRSLEPADVRRQVNGFFKAQRAGRDNIVLGIPRADAVVRILELPKEVEANLKQVVLYQVQSYEPSETEKFYYDYLPVKTAGKEKRLQVLLLMVKKSVLDQHLNFMRGIGLRPRVITLGSAAIGNILLGIRNGSSGRTIVLADLRPDGIETLLLRNGSPVYSRQASRPEQQTWSELLRGEIELAVSRARLGPEETIDDLFLAGDTGEPTGGELTEAIPGTRSIAELMRFEMPPELRPRLRAAAASVGLAFTGMNRRPPLRLNLLPTELRIRQARWAYIPTIILALAIIAGLVGLGMRQAVQQQILIRELDARIQALQSQVNAVNQVREQAESLEKKVLYTEGLLRRRDMNLEILLELTEILPADTYLNIYRNQDCSITISGLSSSAPDLIPALEKSPLLAGVVQRGTIFKDPQSGKDRFQFEAKCER